MKTKLALFFIAAMAITDLLSNNPAFADVNAGATAHNNTIVYSSGNGDEVSRGLHAPSQNGTAIPIQPPRIFAPGKSKVWTQQRIYTWNELYHGTTAEIAKMIINSGDTLQSRPTVQPLPYNKDEVVVLEEIPPPNIRPIYSNRIATKAATFIEITIVRAISHVKAASNTRRVVVLAELFLEGRNASRADAFKVGGNVMAHISGYGLGTGTNYSSGVSKSFTGWVIVVIAYEDVPVIWNVKQQDPVQKPASAQHLDSILFYKGQFLNNADEIIARNVQKIKRKWKNILAGGVINVTITGEPYYDQNELEMIGLKAIKKTGLALKSEMSRNGIEITGHQLHKAFRYSIQQSNKLKSGDGVILFKLSR